MSLAGCAAALAEVRTWTDQYDREFEAELVEASEADVVLSVPAFKVIYTLPLRKLSEGDRAFVAEWRAEREEADAASPAPAPVAAETAEEFKPPATGIDTSAIADNFDAEWPGIISADIALEVTVVEEDEAGKRFVYHSPHYEFVADVRLAQSLVTKFAVMFEATRDYCRLLPISLRKAQVAGSEHRNRVLLFESFGTYLRNGGPPDSAGVYLPARDLVMVPLTSLGVRKVGSSYQFDWDESNKTLPHELAHQLTDPVYFSHGAMGWFSEGLAEYIAVTPYRSGKFNNKTLLGSAKAFVTEYGRQGRGGRALGENIDMPLLESFFLQDYGSFVANGNLNYGVSLLLVYYFFHMDQDGNRAAVTSFLRALRAGREGESALEELLMGRSFETLQEDIVRAWRGRGIRIEFLRSISE